MASSHGNGVLGIVEDLQVGQFCKLNNWREEEEGRYYVACWQRISSPQRLKNPCPLLVAHCQRHAAKLDASCNCHTNQSRRFLKTFPHNFFGGDIRYIEFGEKKRCCREWSVGDI